MSCWNHVAGVIRIDGWPAEEGSDVYSDEFWDKLIGKEVRYGRGMWDEYDKDSFAFMPVGSEGSLQKTVWINPDKSSLASYTVTIFGDLRDYQDCHSIIEWFSGLCEKIENTETLCVRDAVVVSNNEWHGIETWSFNWNEREKVEE